MIFNLFLKKKLQSVEPTATKTLHMKEKQQNWKKKMKFASKFNSNTYLLQIEHFFFKIWYFVNYAEPFSKKKIWGGTQCHKPVLK